MTDNYDGDNLEEKFKVFPNARSILALERSKNPDRQINIERLMTRLDGCMPYDFENEADKELMLLLSEVKRCFVRRIQEAKKTIGFKDELDAFAHYCVNKRITCITFNYDDVFDQSLWEVKKVTAFSEDIYYWHPDGGYGFFCRPSESCVRDTNAYMDQELSMYLLKLHGSINWRIRRGFLPPYAIDSIVHHEPWLPFDPRLKPVPENINFHLEPDPFIVPPVLLKSALIEQPILRMVWSLAYKKLDQAGQVVFIGYSLPITDIASSFLFTETLRNIPVSEIRVVNFAQDEESIKEIQSAYRRVFPGLKDEQFYFRGALEWIKELMGTSNKTCEPST